MTMSAKEIRAARARLGELWGKGRPLYASELARSLRLGGRDPGATVLAWERGKTTVTGPVSALVTLYLSGVKPPDGIPVGGPPSGDTEPPSMDTETGPRRGNGPPSQGTGRPVSGHRAGPRQGTGRRT